MNESSERGRDSAAVSVGHTHLICGALCLIILLIDLAVPLGVAVGVLYIVPVLLSMWYPKRNATYVLAVVGSALIVAGYLLSPQGGPTWQSLSNRALSILAVWSTAILVLQRKALEQKREKAIAAREKALDEVRILRGFLPVCSSCKKIRDDQGYWTQIEAYIRDHSEAEFSHSICPECARRLYPEFYEKADEPRDQV
jgi:hypothetical protein